MWLLSVVLVSLMMGVSESLLPHDAFRHSPSKLRSLYLSSSPDDVDPKSLLYQEHEKLLVARGQREAQLMEQNGKVQPLEANVVRGYSGGSGGFGGKQKSANKKSLLKEQGKAHAKVLRQQGVVRIDNVLPAGLVDEIRKTVYEMRAESEQLVRDGSVPSIDRFADVLLKGNRCDMTIPLGDKWVAEALRSILCASPVGATIQNILGQDAILRELSCLMSDPGSHRQVMHPDTPHKEEPVLYTCFVALQDITKDMGPTTWLPNTHTEEMHAQFQQEQPVGNGDDGNDSLLPSPKDALLGTQPGVLGMLPKGCCAIFDSRLLHCGGANTSDTSRALFYFSFQNPNVPSPGNPGSIRKDLVGKWTLKQLEQELDLFSRGKATSRLLS